MEYFTYEMDVFKFERIPHYDLYFKPSVPPMPDFFPIRYGAHFFVGSFIRRLACAERLRLRLRQPIPLRLEPTSFKGTFPKVRPVRSYRAATA